MKQDLPSDTLAVVDELVRRGWVHEQLDGTNAHAVHEGSKQLFFIGNMTPAVPLIYGIFAESKTYIEAILQAGGVPLAKTKPKSGGFKLMITSNGYFCVLSQTGSLQKISFADVTEQAHPSVKIFAQSVLKLFPGASYISFELQASSLHKKLGKTERMVSDVSFSIEHYSDYMFHKNGQQKPAVEVIADLISSLE